MGGIDDKVGKLERKASEMLSSEEVQWLCALVRSYHSLVWRAHTVLQALSETLVLPEETQKLVVDLGAAREKWYKREEDH